MVRKVARESRMASAAARRSPETSVRSEASMATSVPVPIASPRSAWARAGASLTPSPTMATTRPSPWRRPITSAFSEGSTSAMTSSMPTSAATARAVVSLSPVSSTGRSPSALSAATASAEVGLTVSATTSTPRTAPSQAATIAVRPCASAACLAASSSAGIATLHSAMNAARPSTTPWPSTTPSTPRPSWLAKPSSAGSVPSSSRAARAIAWAIGCSEASSSAPAMASSSPRSWPAAGTTSIRLMRPLVTVPVLSSTIVSTLRVDSRISGPLMSSPSWAPRLVPTSSAVGVASPSAHGHAMISTATAAVNAKARSSPAPIQKPSVATASPITNGTKIPETRSASRWTGALPDCASTTSLAIWASAVSAPTLVARTIRRPPAFTDAPATSSPGRFSTGTDSPVSCDWSTALTPSSTTPSVATFSPGRTTKRSPTASCSTGTRCSSPSASRRATSLAPSSSSAVSAAPARRLARASKYRPARRKTVTAVATSR